MHWFQSVLLLSSIYSNQALSTSNTHASWRAQTRTVLSGKGSKLLAVPSNEKLVRNDIEKKGSLVAAEDEVNYSSTINEGADAEVKVEPPTAEDKSILAKKIERALKPRAYPLFLAEKAAILIEQTFASKNKQSFQSEITIDGTRKKKERIVVLGTGWGAASFLKEIDTSKYEVTVISPRNFFLFTPMLAGASVGTVEFRSITEPVREVSFLQKAPALKGFQYYLRPNFQYVLCIS